MSSYQRFIFTDYNFDANSKTLRLNYSLDNQLSFTETYVFDFDFVPGYNTQALDRALQNLFFMAGVSYYKTYLPKDIVIQKGTFDQPAAKFFSKTYQHGLGEFFYVNQLDPTTPIDFPASSSEIPAVNVDSEGLLIGIGGGKDSLVTAELLRNQPKVASWSLNHRSQLEPLVKEIGLTHFWVDRDWDDKLTQLNKSGAYNGHVPISAIFACVGTVVAILTGYKDTVVSNESSANEPSLSYQGVPINHQYSKSFEFETDYQKLLQHQFSATTGYFSFLRPLSEVRIAEVFARVAFDKYEHLFSSCNRAFVHSSDHMSWCGQCSKCAFTFLALTPFVERQKLEQLWGKNLLLDPNLEETYRQLLGIEGEKPLDCVGEIKEAREAMTLAKDIYPELVKYSFDLPADYSYKSLAEHSMPAELFGVLEATLQRL